MQGSQLIAKLKRQFGTTSDQELAEKLGITNQSVQNWKSRRRVSERQVVGLVYRARLNGEKFARDTAIRPIVEFFPLGKCDSANGAKFEIFATIGGNGDERAYRKGLQDELKAHHGIYIFFDSRGQAIYTGKARRQSLWTEIKNAFNREREGLQKIKRVYHPTRNQPYATSREKARQIVDQSVYLHDIAVYFSAYQVSDGMIDDLEAMLVRGFANDLLNKRMERFGIHRRNSH